MPTILSRLSILFINHISRDLDDTIILFYKLFVRYLIVKPAYVNAALISKFLDKFKLIGFYCKFLKLEQHTSKGVKCVFSS